MYRQAYLIRNERLLPGSEHRFGSYKFDLTSQRGCGASRNYLDALDLIAETTRTSFMGPQIPEEYS